MIKIYSLINFLEEKKLEILDIIPRLNDIFNQRQEETTVEIIKGKRVLRTITNDVFSTLKNTKQPLLAMGIDERKYSEFDELGIKQYISKLRKFGLKEKLNIRSLIEK